MRNFLKCFSIIPLILLFQVIEAPAITKDELKSRQLELWSEQDSLNGEISGLNKEVDRIGRQNMLFEELLQGDGLVFLFGYEGRRFDELGGYYLIPKPKVEEFANLMATIATVTRKRFYSTDEVMQYLSEVDKKERGRIKNEYIPVNSQEINRLFAELTAAHRRLEKVKAELAMVEQQLEVEATAEAKITHDALDEFKIVSVNLPSQVESDGPREDLTASWTGGGKFPAKVVYRPKSGGCPKGFSCGSPTKGFGSSEKPVVLEDAVYCYGVREGSAYFNYEVVIIDATGKESAPVSAAFTCTPKR